MVVWCLNSSWVVPFSPIWDGREGGDEKGEEERGRTLCSSHDYP